MAKKKVFLTGASGSMGGIAFKELLGRRDSYDIRILLRPSKVNKENFTRYETEPGVEVVWGDLTAPDDVLKCVTGIDVILHPAAMIAPAADHNPEMARKINVGAARNIVDAIKKQPDNGDNIKFVNVGSVAEYGDRRPPYEMIMVGDPLKPCIIDYYATTKIDAEKIVVDSGLKYWASIRQCFVAIPNALSL
ncbi:MAG: NAD-dependent epimerase/dehydratase family protein, partial [Actinobacteria bacterium]|nr:NAD-dependent epimerase/dehydratase family protein [Actinomycetota bacterium]